MSTSSSSSHDNNPRIAQQYELDNLPPRENPPTTAEAELNAYWDAYYKDPSSGYMFPVSAMDRKHYWADFRMNVKVEGGSGVNGKTKITVTSTTGSGSRVIDDGKPTEMERKEAMVQLEQLRINEPWEFLTTEMNAETVKRDSMGDPMEALCLSRTDALQGMLQGKRADRPHLEVDRELKRYEMLLVPEYVDPTKLTYLATRLGKFITSINDQIAVFQKERTDRIQIIESMHNNDAVNQYIRLGELTANIAQLTLRITAVKNMLAKVEAKKKASIPQKQRLLAKSRVYQRQQEEEEYGDEYDDVPSRTSMRGTAGPVRRGYREESDYDEKQQRRSAYSHPASYSSSSSNGTSSRPSSSPSSSSSGTNVRGGSSSMERQYMYPTKSGRGGSSGGRY